MAASRTKPEHQDAGQWDMEVLEAKANYMMVDDDSSKSSGQSVYDAESVVGESGNLYQNYKPGKYLLPNDAAEQDRLDIMHVSFRLLLDGRLALAPFTESPHYVLDIGTGTGIWAIQFAEEHPDSQVIGTDLSAIQPPFTIANCSFQKDDAEEEIALKWVFQTPNSRFDYIHLRFMVTCFDQPKKVMENAFRYLNPGGWIEFQDSTLPIIDLHKGEEGSAVKRWNDYVSTGAAKLKRDFYKASRYKEWLEEVGFVDVEEHYIEWPMGPWSSDPRLKESGWYLLRSIMAGLRGMSWALLSLAGVSPEEIEDLLEECRKDVLNRKYAWCFGVYVVYGRKPLDDGISQDK
ncbi:putative S-adenosyl-L-methionine-dependent methyltransferase [Seiridium cardinale]|uniref:S-adenosyl-L-methionine-dependent methyltransferase n=1 Tax=Seiridium cardinale TaxID=138064 RepID=A0ABR2XRP5_9PEZI